MRNFLWDSAEAINGREGDCYDGCLFLVVYQTVCLLGSINNINKKSQNRFTLHFSTALHVSFKNKINNTVM